MSVDPRIVSVVHDPSASYPSTPNYGPLSSYPERPAGGLSFAPNAAYELVRSALAGAGCDSQQFDTASWSPFRDFVARGERIHVLPNLVTQRRGFETDEHTFQGKVTHASVLQPVLDYAVKAAGSADLVSVGNAPLQGCDFARVTEETGLRQLLANYFAARGDAVTLADLRGLRTDFTSSGAIRSRVETGEPSVSVDLGTDSLLEPLYTHGRSPQFRVGDYPGSATASFHGQGRHVYVINRRVLQASLLVSVPKLKTHEKVGITCALKGTVGAIARKECLAHHRHGGARQGGDEYRRDSLAARATSGLLEHVSELPINPWSNALRLLATSMFRAFRVLSPGNMGGAWSGNDTAWRMTLDIARVLRYATIDGRLSDSPQRQHIAVVDGIVSGEGDGPLHQRARDTHAVLFGADPCLVDWACALVMGFPPERIPLLREAFRPRRFPLTDARRSDLDLRLNGLAVRQAEMESLFEPPHVPPTGWRAQLAGAG